MKHFPLSLLLFILFSIQWGCASRSGSDESRPELPQYLVHLNCPLTDYVTIEQTLRLAKSLCGYESEVILFVDLDAVLLADKNLAELDENQRAVISALFASLDSYGGQILVCPHCAGRLNITKECLRKGSRFTTKKELEETVKKADQVFDLQLFKESKDKTT